MDASSNSTLNEDPISGQSFSSLQTTQVREKTRRPQLSCNQCRSRKVRCDRYLPCSACAQHQIGHECKYDLSESERQPILQAEALKDKQREIDRLKQENEELRGGPSMTGQIDEHGFLPGYYARARRSQHAHRSSLSRQHLQTHFTSSSVYFGSPSMAAVTQEFANLSSHRRPGSLTHTTPITPFQPGTIYPFPTLSSNEIASLICHLPSEAEIFLHLESFQHRAQAFSFSHTSGACTAPEVKCFLSNLEHNAHANPDMLALLLAALAQGLQCGAYDRCGQDWNAGEIEVSCDRGDHWIAASMQALRLASFLSRPTLLIIETLTVICSYLTNSGRLLDAWALFGTAIRLAQGIGLHRDPLIVDPAASSEVAASRKALWWSMIHIDQQYSLTLGRPLGISSIGDCPKPEPQILDTTARSLSVFFDNFSILGRQILSTAYMTDQHIDDFTEQFLLLQSTLPEILRFNALWLDKERSVPPWPHDAQAALVHAKLHIYMLLLNRQHSQCVSTIPQSHADHSAHHLELRGRERVLDSCRGLLLAFNFLFTRCRAAMICWTMTQHAFNASMLLTLSMFETHDQQDLHAVQMALTAFIEMSKLGVHRLAGAAVIELNDLIRGFHAGQRPKDSIMGQQGMYILENSRAAVFQDEFYPFHYSMPSAFGSLNSDFSTPTSTITNEVEPSMALPLNPRRHSKTQHHPKASSSSGNGVNVGKSRQSSSNSKKTAIREKRLPIHRKLSTSSRRSPKMSGGNNGGSKQPAQLRRAQTGDISLFIPEQRVFDCGAGESSNADGGLGSQSATQTAFPTPIATTATFQGLASPAGFGATSEASQMHGYQTTHQGAYHFPMEGQPQTLSEQALTNSQAASQFTTPTEPNFNFGGFAVQGSQGQMTPGGFVVEGAGSSSGSGAVFTRPSEPVFKTEYDDEHQHGQLYEYRPHHHYQATETNYSPDLWRVGYQQQGSQIYQQQQQQQQQEQSHQHQQQQRHR